MSRLERMISVVKEDPEDPDAAFFFAAWLASNGSTREALETLHMVTNKHPNYPGIWLFKATLYDQLNDRKMADLCRARAKDVADRPAPELLPKGPSRVKVEPIPAVVEEEPRGRQELHWEGEGRIPADESKVKKSAKRKLGLRIR